MVFDGGLRVNLTYSAVVLCRVAQLSYRQKVS